MEGGAAEDMEPKLALAGSREAGFGYGESRRCEGQSLVGDR